MSENKNEEQLDLSGDTGKLFDSVDFLEVEPNGYDVYNNDIPDLENRDQEDYAYVPTQIRDIKYYNKIKYEKFVIGMIVVVLTAIVIGTVSTSVVTTTISDVNAKADRKDHQLTAIEESYGEEVEEFYSKLDKVLNNSYDYEKYVKELGDLTIFRKRISEEDWYNPYSDTTSDFYNKTLEDLDRYEGRLKSAICKDLSQEIESFKPDKSIFDENGNAKPENTTVEYLRKVKFGYNSDPDKTGSDIAVQVLTDLNATYENIINNQNNYDVYSDEDFNKVCSLYSDIRTQIESIYSVALNKETSEEAQKKADEEFDKKKEELTNQIEEEVTEKVTKEVTDKLNSEHEKEVSGLEKDIKDLKSERDSLKKQLTDLNKKYEDLKNSKK